MISAPTSVPTSEPVTAPPERPDGGHAWRRPAP